MHTDCANSLSSFLVLSNGPLFSLVNKTERLPLRLAHDGTASVQEQKHYIMVLQRCRIETQWKKSGMW